MVQQKSCLIGEKREEGMSIYNENIYPSLYALLGELDLETKASWRGFS